MNVPHAINDYSNAGNIFLLICEIRKFLVLCFIFFTEKSIYFQYKRIKNCTVVHAAATDLLSR